MSLHPRARGALRLAAAERGLVAVVPGYVGRSPEGAADHARQGRFGPLGDGAREGARLRGGLDHVRRGRRARRRPAPGSRRLPASRASPTGRPASSPGSARRSSIPGRWSRPRRPASRSSCATPSRPRAREPTSRASTREPGVRCVALRQNVAMEIPCTDGREGRAAMVVCIGSPDDERPRSAARRCLREAGIPVQHFGIAAAGLVFVVAADVASMRCARCTPA